MRCPACGSDTNPSLPFCTRCDAALSGGGTDPTSQDPGSHDRTAYDPTAHDPFSAPGQGPAAEPVPPPWTTPPPLPEGWDPPPGGTPEEHTISLSQEPWVHEEHEQWAEEVWSPAPPPGRRALPYVLIGGGTVLLALVAAAIVFWPSGERNDGAVAGAPSVAGEASPGAASDPESAPEGGAAGLNKQAGQVDALLTEMSSTRNELGTAVVDGCRTGALEQIYTQRQEQLRKARALPVDALENGTELRDALVRALEASAASNRTYVEMSPGCPSDDDVASVNDQASAAKREFIDHWRPNAEKAGLDVRSADTI